MTDVKDFENFLKELFLIEQKNLKKLKKNNKKLCDNCIERYLEVMHLIRQYANHLQENKRYLDLKKEWNKEFQKQKAQQQLQKIKQEEA